LRTFWDFIWADVKMTARNKQALFWSFFFPVLLMGLLGIVFGQEGSFAARLAVVDEAGGPLAATMTGVFKQVPALKVTSVGDRQAALDDLKNGDYAAVLVLPAGLGEGADEGSTALPFYYDNSSPVQAATVTGVVQQVVQEFGFRVSGTRPTFRLAAQPVAAQGFDYIDFLVPGVIAMAIMTNGIYAVSGTFVTYRQKGVLRRLRATPLPPGSFVSAYVLVNLVRSLMTAALVLAVGILIFNVNVTGPGVLARTVVLALIGSGTFVSLGFFVAAVAKNIEVAAALGQVIGTPMMFLSGIFFPMDNAPRWIQPVVNAMPLKYLADALRGVIISGQTLWTVRWDVVVLVVFGTAFLGLSVRFFRWE